VTIILVSAGNKTGLDILDSVLGRSFKYRRNNYGSRIETWWI